MQPEQHNKENQMESQLLVLTVTPVVTAFLYDYCVKSRDKSERRRINEKMLRNVGICAIARLVVSKVQSFFSWSTNVDVTSAVNYSQLTRNQSYLSTCIVLFTPLLGENGLYVSSGMFGWHLAHFLATYIVSVPKMEEEKTLSTRSTHFATNSNKNTRKGWF